MVPDCPGPLVSPLCAGHNCTPSARLRVGPWLDSRASCQIVLVPPSNIHLSSADLRDVAAQRLQESPVQDWTCRVCPHPQSQTPPAETVRLLRHELPLAGPCCCHHCPPPSGHGFQEQFSMSFPGMEVTEQPTVAWSFLLGEGCDVCLFSGSGTCCSHQDFSQRCWPAPSAPPGPVHAQLA